MRSLTALVLLLLALAGVTARVCPVDVDACGGADVLAAQTVLDDDALDDTPWEPVDLGASGAERVSPAPDVHPSRHVPLLSDERRYRPPRA